MDRLTQTEAGPRRPAARPAPPLAEVRRVLSRYSRLAAAPALTRRRPRAAAPGGKRDPSAV